MTKRFKDSSELMSPSLLTGELSAFSSSGYPKDSFVRFGIDLSAVILSYLDAGEQVFYRGLNHLSATHMFDQTQILVLEWIRDEKELVDIQQLAMYYRRTVRKVWINLDIYGIDTSCHFLTELLKGRKPLEVLYLYSASGWCNSDKICHLINSIDSNFAKDLYLDFTLCMMEDTTFDLLKSKLGGCLAGIGLQMTRYDYFEKHKSSFRIKKLKIWMTHPVSPELKEISDRFPDLERLYIFAYEEFHYMGLLIPLSQSYFPNIKYFAFHYTEGTPDTLHDMCDKGHRLIHYLSRKEFPAYAVMYLHGHSHLVYSKTQKSIWIVTNTYLGYPQLPSYVKNLSFVWSEENRLLAEELQGINILKANPRIEYFRSRDVSMSFLFNDREELKFEKEEVNYIFRASKRINPFHR